MDLYYEDLGEGVPILLIHPAGATASTWGSVTEELARIGRVITYDRRGYARSGGEAPRSIAAHTADAAALLEHLETPPAVVVGTSAGAAIAVDLAVRRPDLVQAVVAHEFPWRFTRHLPSGSQVAGLARIGSFALRGRPTDAAEALLRSAFTYRDGRSAWDAFPEEWRQAGRENARAALVDFRNSIGAYPSAADLATVRVPVVCSYGARSPESMFRLVRWLAAAIPTARTHRIEGAGHAAPFDATTNFVQLIADAMRTKRARKEGRTMFEVTARLKIRDGELDGFKQQAAEVMREAREKDTKTLRYDWFISEDGTQCEVREGYTDADALLEHSDHVGEVRAKLFRDFAYDHDMTLYGEPSPALVAAFEAMGDAVKYTQFGFFQGLETTGANRQLLEHYVERYNAGDLDACMELYAEDAVQLMHDGIFQGVSEIHERLARDLTAFPDAKYTVVSFVEQGDSFADEWTFVGTHAGPFLLPDGSELPPTGKRVEVKGMELVQVRDGKIVVDNLYYDSITVLAQLGLVLEARPQNQVVMA